MFKLVKGNSDKISAIAEVMASEAHMQGIQSCINSELERLGLEVDKDMRPRIGWDDASLALNVRESFDRVEYDKFLSCKDATISSTENIDIYFTRTVVAMPQNVETRITFSFTCPLDEGDLETLEMLGKVHREIRPASIDTQVYCDVPF